MAEARYTGRVPTDTWPVHFRYISRRLVKEIVQQHEATRPRVKVSFSLPLRAIGLTLIRRDPDYLNLFDLTRRATEGIENLTGTVEFPGKYVRSELDITPGYFTVLMGWRDRSHVDIAAMMTRTHVEDVGSVLVGLFGSISNYMWRVPKSEDFGEIPSDVTGLYEILDRTAENGDPTLDAERVEHEVDVIPESRADTVLRLLGDRFKGFRRERLDLLIEVFYCFDDYSFGGCHFDRVLIGAPVWVATPALRPLTRS